MLFIYKCIKQIITTSFSWKATRINRVLLVCLASPVSIVTWRPVLNGLEFTGGRVYESLDEGHHYPLALVYQSNNTNPLVTTQDDVLGGGVEMRSMLLATQIDSKLIQDMVHYMPDKAIQSTS